jgi:hypothetical protein
VVEVSIRGTNTDAERTTTAIVRRTRRKGHYVSVLILELEDALPDEKLEIQFLTDWSAMRSAHSERQVFAYSVKSDSGQTYETEIFMSDVGSICSFCNCKASELGQRKCRHVRAVLADMLERKPDFGKEMTQS